MGVGSFICGLGCHVCDPCYCLYCFVPLVVGIMSGWCRSTMHGERRGEILVRSNVFVETTSHDMLIAVESTPFSLATTKGLRSNMIMVGRWGNGSNQVNRRSSHSYLFTRPAVLSSSHLEGIDKGAGLLHASGDGWESGSCRLYLY